MFRRQPLWIACAVLVLSCGRATVRDVRHMKLVVAGVSFDDGKVTVLTRQAACPSQWEKFTANDPDAATRACMRSLADGEQIELIERRMHFALMTCGAKPTVNHSLGPCVIPDAKLVHEITGEVCKS